MAGAAARRRHRRRSPARGSRPRSKSETGCRTSCRPSLSLPSPAALRAAPSPAVRERGPSPHPGPPPLAGEGGVGAWWVRVAYEACSSNHRNVRRVDGFHADDMIAAIDVVNLAADPGRQVAQQIDAGTADILDRDIALERRVQLV